MEKEKGNKEDTTFRWCEKREQKVAVTVCRAMARKKKYCLKCLEKYDQLPLFPGLK
ncbi:MULTISPECIES: hypothetical protein [Desulfatibacillum]|jgi:hypothetical protein|uniref:Uncharacterized protein n=2 Tax=Desulfatibacillum TaxID=218207 RepID=B8FB97_DESAL|nr:MULTISPECIES: hypothetical protein [Desulfatibacillum]ACL04541.1 hypothetical protein Dalk_2851 [Desulfatibacillum aliphaticivorans]SHJ11731.1 hypothetical protein SAMN02745216_01063 [Desulfatibacillum alkenivorans DSM 16219]